MPEGINRYVNVCICIINKVACFTHRSCIVLRLDLELNDGENKTSSPTLSLLSRVYFSQVSSAPIHGSGFIPRVAVLAQQRAAERCAERDAERQAKQQAENKLLHGGLGAGSRRQSFNTGGANSVLKRELAPVRDYGKVHFMLYLHLSVVKFNP